MPFGFAGAFAGILGNVNILVPSPPGIDPRLFELQLLAAQKQAISQQAINQMQSLGSPVIQAGLPAAEPAIEKPAAAPISGHRELDLDPVRDVGVPKITARKIEL